MSTSDRRARLSRVLAERDVPGAFVTRLVNVRYLTGFTGSNGAVFVGADGRAILATDGRYKDQAADESPDVDLLVDRKTFPALVRRAVGDGLTRAAFETHALTVDAQNAVHKEHSGLETVSLEKAVERLRVDKDDEELAAIREACGISARALESLWAETELSGRTEKEIARDLEARMYAEGGDGPAFETIVAAGEHSAIPHHQPTDRAVRPGDLLKIDFGALYRGYHADCTRTAVVGAEPAAWQKEIYDLVKAAQAAGCRALAPDAELKVVDAASRDPIKAAGYGEHFSHGLGHGVGLEIHEDPFLSHDADGKLRDRTPVTVEPGVYLAGRGGVRIEDTLVVRSDGPELLTTTTKDLRVLD